jgi:hypothetical protein
MVELDLLILSTTFSTINDAEDPIDDRLGEIALVGHVARL